MKRKSKEKILNINQPTRLFLEDLEQIYSIINDTMGSVSVENDDYEFENLQDLLELKSPSLTNLKLVGYKGKWPQIFFFINPGSIHIRIDKDEPSLLGTIEKVKEIITARKRYPMLSPAIKLLLSCVPFVLVLSSLIYLFVSRKPDGAFYTLIGLSWLLIVPVLFLNIPPRNQIILAYSKNVPSFWKRNSDGIIVATITSILTLIIGFLFGKITGFIP
jgi:hypothetical protein